MSHRSRIAAVSAAVMFLLAVLPASAPAAAWLPARDASERGFPAGSPTAAVGADGTRVEAWVREFEVNSDTKYRVQYRQTGADGTRHEIVTVSGPPSSGTQESVPAVAVGPDGTAVLAWIKAVSNGWPTDVRITMVRIGADGQPIGTPAPISAPVDSADYLVAAPRGDGAVQLAWTSYDGTRSAIDSVRVGADGTAGVVRTLIAAPDDGPDTSYQWENGASLAVAPDGRGVVTAALYHYEYSPSFSATRSVKAVRLGADGTPSATVHDLVADASAGGNTQPSAGVADDGDAIATYAVDNGDGTTTVIARRLAADDTLGPVRTLTSDARGYTATAVAPGGGAVVAWQAPDDTVRMGHLDAAGEITTTDVAVSTPGTGDYPSVAFGRDGNGLIAWDEYDGTDNGAFARTIAPGGALGAATPISGRIDSIGEVRLAGGGDDALAFWYAEDPATSNYLVQTALRDATAPVARTFAVPTTATAAAAAVFAADAVDASGVTYAWSFGDGQGGTGPIAQHAYAAPGTFTVKLTLTDGAGNARVQEGTITVGGAPPEDGAPTVAFTAPAAGAKLVTGKATHVTATATDDRGVASVVFSIGAREVCRDTTAPYTCDVRPTGADVGRQALIAVATDGAGQTATATRAVTVPRFAPQSLTVRAARKGGAIVVSGKLGLPAGVSKAAGCTGKVAVTLSAGAWSRTVTTKLTSSCALRSVRVRSGGTGARVTVRASFAGNDVLAERAAKRVTVRR